MNNELFEKLRTLISEGLGVEEDEINSQSHLQEDLNADPLATADLMVKIEDEFQIKIPEDQTQQFRTVNDLLEYISEQSGEI